MNHLPIEKIPTQGKKALIISLSISVGLVLLVNMAFFFYLKKYKPNKAYALISHKWNKIFETSSKANWLILGDSSGNQGVDAQQFETVGKGKALNLCTIADMLVVNDLWMLEKYIEQHGAPTKLLLVHTYDIWHRSEFPLGYMAQIPLFLKQDSTLSMRDLALPNWKKCLMNYFPLNYQRSSIAYLLQHPSLWFETSFKADQYGFEQRKEANIAAVLQDCEEHLIFVKSNRFEVSHQNRQALERLAAIAHQHHIQVYLSNAPIYEKLYQDEKFQVYYQDMQNFLFRFCQANNWGYINAPPMTFSVQEMENVDHLILTAARRFTTHLIQEMNEKKNIPQ